jgi:hypothetical protein
MNSTFRTAEQAKADNIRLMGEDLGQIYHALWQQIAWVHAKWSEHVILFGTKESRIDLLNSVAPSFFRLIQDSLWENVLLHIAKLTDSPATGKKTNLTIQRLAELIGDVQTKTKVQELVIQALGVSEFARDWLNRHIAHCDLDLALSKSVHALEMASRQKVRTALQALTSVMNAIAEHYLDTTIFFETTDGDAESLLYVLDDGLAADEARRERLRNGQYDPNEHQPRNL